VIRVRNGETLRVSFLEGQNDRFHGISMGASSTKGRLVIDGTEMSGFMILNTQKPQGFEVKCLDPDGLINFHHVYGSEEENNGTPMSLMYGSGMILEQRDDGLLVYRCNDTGINNGEFKDFIFSVERL